MTCFWITSPPFLSCRQFGCCCPIAPLFVPCDVHCATRVDRRVLCFARRCNLEVPHDDSRSASVSCSRVNAQNGVTPLPFIRGGLGLQSASRIHIAACWASWAGGLDAILMSGDAPGHGSESIRGVVECEGILQSVGFDVPTWTVLAQCAHPIQSGG